ncbi:hypothetical protein QBC42DRAFT_282342 [Cladorrhinum samala]|uniref:Cellobiose dehydrogenase-like cytochrome domain-containing protein n=1 Tax=Cladorrhinum samala TaxID=585594 RepID=A0AAV9I0I1_9PEZI|nr:hypothetical protein QBC42DRAFT_282342 [Cladorrhinum samala]
MHSLNQLRAGTAALLCLFLARSSFAQLTPYIDPTTGITLHAHSPAKDYQLGFVFPEKVTTDFIAQIVAPLKDGQGWAGVALGKSMLSTLLIATWPNTENHPLVAAFYATQYGPLSPYTNNLLIISPMPSATYINGTHITSTFACHGCINSDSFNPSDIDTVQHDLGYAFSTKAVEGDPNDPKAVKLTKHTSQGTYQVLLGAAKDPKYTDDLGFSTVAAELDGSSSGTKGEDDDHNPSKNITTPNAAYLIPSARSHESSATTAIAIATESLDVTSITERDVVVKSSKASVSKTSATPSPTKKNIGVGMKQVSMVFVLGLVLVAGVL